MDPAVLHNRHMRHVELLRKQRDDARAEIERLRDTVRWYVAEREAHYQGRATAALPEAWEALRHVAR